MYQSQEFAQTPNVTESMSAAHLPPIADLSTHYEQGLEYCPD
jgi:hypothetical protein